MDPILKGLIFRPIFRGFVDRMGLNGNERILDFGSGPGILSEMIARKLEKGGGKLTCLDVTEQWFTIAKKRLRKFQNVEFVFGDVREKAIPENSFDGIVMHYVLHDIDKDARAPTVSALIKTLSNGGKIFIREPTRGGHSMPAEEIRSLMKGNMLVESKSKLGRLIFMATYTKV